MEYRVNASGHKKLSSLKIAVESGPLSGNSLTPSGCLAGIPKLAPGSLTDGSWIWIKVISTNVLGKFVALASLKTFGTLRKNDIEVQRHFRGPKFYVKIWHVEVLKGCFVSRAGCTHPPR